MLGVFTLDVAAGVILLYSLFSHVTQVFAHRSPFGVITERTPHHLLEHLTLFISLFALCVCVCVCVLPSPSDLALASSIRQHHDDRNLVCLVILCLES
jgi:hypothetical protein